MGGERQSLWNVLNYWLCAGTRGAGAGGAWETEGGAWGVWAKVAWRSQASTETRAQCGRWQFIAATQVDAASADAITCCYSLSVQLLAAFHPVIAFVSCSRYFMNRSFASLRLSYNYGNCQWFINAIQLLLMWLTTAPCFMKMFPRLFLRYFRKFRSFSIILSHLSGESLQCRLFSSGVCCWFRRRSLECISPPIRVHRQTYTHTTMDRSTSLIISSNSLCSIGGGENVPHLPQFGWRSYIVAVGKIHSVLSWQGRGRQYLSFEKFCSCSKIF